MPYPTQPIWPPPPPRWVALLGTLGLLVVSITALIFHPGLFSAFPDVPQSRIADPGSYFDVVACVVALLILAFPARAARVVGHVSIAHWQSDGLFRAPTDSRTPYKPVALLAGAVFGGYATMTLLSVVAFPISLLTDRVFVNQFAQVPLRPLVAWLLLSWLAVGMSPGSSQADVRAS